MPASRFQRAFSRHFRGRPAGLPVRTGVCGWPKELARVGIGPQANSFVALAWNHYATSPGDEKSASALAQVLGRWRTHWRTVQCGALVVRPHAHMCVQQNGNNVI